MSQILINIGNSANDGTGTPIRTAFYDVNQNFTELYNRVQAAPGNLIGVSGDEPGMYAVTANTFYYCYANYTGNSIIWAEIPDVGNIQQILNGNSNVSISNSDGNITLYVDNTLNSTFSNIGLVVSGNVTGDYLYGDGSNISNISWSNIANANTIIADYLPTYTGNLDSIAGNITSTSNITAAYLFGDGSNIINLPLGDYSNSNVASYLPTYTGNIDAVTGNITTTANITASYLFGDGSNITGIVSNYSNSNVASYLPTYTGTLNTNDFNVSGPITGDLIPSANITYSLGNATNHWKDLWLSNNTLYLGNVALSTSANTLSVAGANVVTSSNGTLSITTLSTTGDITGQNLYTGGVVSAAGNVRGINLNTGGLVSAVGNVYGNVFIGNGSQLSGLPAGYANSNVASYLPDYYGNISISNVVLGNASNTFSTTSWAVFQTSTTLPVTIASIPATNLSSIDVNVIATDTDGNSRQVTKIIAAVMGNSINYSEYGTAAIGNRISTLSMSISSGNAQLVATAVTSNTIQYNLVLTSF